MRVIWHKETDSEERTVHNTRTSGIRDYLKFKVICNNLFVSAMKKNLYSISSNLLVGINNY